MMKSPKRQATLVSPLDDLVKQRLFEANRPEERRRAQASGNRGYGCAAHGERIPQRSDWRGSEALE